MIRGWFKKYSQSYNDFIKALLLDDKKAMNYYMNKVALETFSSFDTGNRPSKSAEPEHFIMGLCLGLWWICQAVIQLPQTGRVVSGVMM